MVTVPVKQTPDTSAADTVEHRFRQLEATWMTEVGHHASTTKLVDHRAFQEIIRLGPAVVPFMLQHLEKRPRLWVWALPEITGADPVPVSDRGNTAEMSEAWLRWARAKDYRW
jgi:hypothetical protein